MEFSEDDQPQLENPLNLGSSGVLQRSPNDDYMHLQRSIFLVIVIVSAIAVAFTALVFGLNASCSVLVGTLAGSLYLRLLARSVGQLGKGSKAVNKVQLVIPVLLLLAVFKIPQLELFPSLLGFLLYKPSLVIQAIFESRTREA